MVRRAGLGKGLGALIPSDIAGASSVTQLIDIPVGEIEPNPNQPRVHFDEASLEELAASIRELGVLQPVLVRAVDTERYQLIAGERRWRAARRAGLATVPALLRESDDLTSVEQALVENLHRQDLGPLEEAAAYQQLLEDFELTHEQVATRVGKSRSSVTNSLRLLSLPAVIQHLLADGRLSAGHAKALLATPDRAFQEHLARKASSEGWSVRAVEDAIRARGGQAEVTDEGEPGAADSGAGRERSRAQPLRPPGLLELEELLAEHLATKVSVTMVGRRGRVQIEFADLEDLERIYRMMTEPPLDAA